MPIQTTSPQNKNNEESSISRHVPHSIAVISSNIQIEQNHHSNIALNLVMALSQCGKRVVFFDADDEISPAHTATAQQSPESLSGHDLSHVINGTCKLKDIFVEGPCGICLMPGGISTTMRTIPSIHGSLSLVHAGLIHAFSELNNLLDILVINVAPDISDSTIDFSSASHDIIVVVNNELRSIDRANQLIQTLHSTRKISRFHVLVNEARDVFEGRQTFFALQKIIDCVCDVSLDFMGFVPRGLHQFDLFTTQLTSYPPTHISNVFHQFAKNINEWPLFSEGHHGGMSFFTEQLVSNSCRKLKKKEMIK